MLYDVYIESLRREFRGPVVKAMFTYVIRDPREIRLLLENLPVRVGEGLSLEEAERLKARIETGEFRWLKRRERIDKSGRRRYSQPQWVEHSKPPAGETCCAVSVRPRESAA